MLSKIANTQQIEREEAAEFFLEKFISRPEVQIVAHRDDRLVDDPRLNWTLRLGEPAWLYFVDSLVRHGLAKWEILSTGGRPKNRLVLEVAPAIIYRRSSSDERVQSFWKDF